MIDAIAKAFQEGGLFMYFIATTSAFTGAIVLERLIQLFIRYRSDSVAVTALVATSLRQGKIDEDLVPLVEAQLPSPIMEMATAIVIALPHGAKAVYDATVESRIAVNPDINRRTGYLAMFANVATLLGLLGTIIGLIAAFAGVAAADPAKKQQMLATGISVAMNTTAYGLMVAIPAMVAYALLTSRVIQLNDEADLLEQRVVSIIDEMHPGLIEEDL